ncbi:MAG TPA: tRNA dihydrouridine synthase DusB [Polyangiaceae bacterium]|nr:tRNA dihydrouridine synthase DusB [Polyangiaceae bacterium]
MTTSLSSAPFQAEAPPAPEPPARPGEFAPVRIGKIEVWPPVVLAPMAGVTNYPFRRLCRSFGAGLYVSEMIAARALVEQQAKSLFLSDFGPDESPRSLQLYGVDPKYVGEAVRRLVGEGRVDHIDMNFGCPVRKVTRKGGGAAIPARPKLLARIVRAAVQAAGDVPVTLKFRIGIDERLRTDWSSGRVAEDEGCRAVGLHARTAAQLYDGQARWDAIGELKQRLKIPVLGNGDIWEASDALRMMRQTGCDGVIVGRGCLGRPWLFRELADVFAGEPARSAPPLGIVVEVLLQHARWTVEWFGERPAMRAFRRMAAWYTKGFKGSARLRQSFTQVETLAELEAAVRELDPVEPFPRAALRVSRGKHSGTQVVSLPEGFLDHLDDDAVPEGADEELGGDGG